MPFDNRHAPLDSPRLTGEPMAPTPGVNDNSNRIATTALVQAVARRPPPANPTIQLFGDLRGSGTISINATVTGIQGRHVTTDPPADTEVYVWSQAAYAWELVPACLLGQQSDGNDLVQVSDGAGGFVGSITHVAPGTYPGANVTVDRHGLIQRISSGILDPAVIPDAPSDGLFYGRQNGTWGSVAPIFSPIFTGNPSAPTPPPSDNDTSVATTAFVKAQGYATSASVVGTVALNLVATGIDAATALALSADFNEVLTIPPGTGVRLSAAMGTPGRRCQVAAYDAVSQENLLLYPLAGQTFFYGGVSNGVDQPLVINNGNVLEVRAASPTKVYVVSSTS